MLHHVRQFPREERFRLTARFELVMFTFRENLLYTAKTKEISYYLRKAEAEFHMLRTYLRFALEPRCPLPKQTIALLSR